MELGGSNVHLCSDLFQVFGRKRTPFSDLCPPRSIHTMTASERNRGFEMVMYRSSSTFTVKWKEMLFSWHADEWRSCLNVYVLKFYRRGGAVAEATWNGSCLLSVSRPRRSNLNSGDTSQKQAFKDGFSWRASLTELTVQVLVQMERICSSLKD